MKILITGNLGYVGPGVVQEFRKHYPQATLIGYDTGYFSKYATGTSLFPDNGLDVQYYGDMRSFPGNLLEGVDTVVALAAISNDPMGNKFEAVTLDINYRSIVELARRAKAQGVRRFVFASSCSVYGAAGEAPKTESDSLNPLTAYAKSKINTELELIPLADEAFQVTCLRFATACGMSERLRLDLVLNDFVAGAITSGRIDILSDGSPWRPLINVLDMARAIRWAHERQNDSGGPALVINTGSNAWNYQVKDLAYKVQESMPGVEVSINPDAAPDKRSYRVSFDLYQQLAPLHQPLFDLETTVRGLIEGLSAIGFNDPEYRKSKLIRLNVIQQLLDLGLVDRELRVIS